MFQTGSRCTHLFDKAVDTGNRETTARRTMIWNWKLQCFPTSAFDNVVSPAVNISSGDVARSMCNSCIMIFNSNDGDVRSHARVARTTGGFKCPVI